jgi:hypothetical protein
MKLTTVLLASVFILAATPLPAAAWDDSFRCGVHLVNVGDSEEVVLDKCGRPTSSIRKTVQWQWFTTTVDQWTYDSGPSQFARILTFDVTANRLLTILIGDYGK